MSKHKKQKQSLPEEISWKAPNAETPNRSPFWYAVFALLSAGVIIYALFYDGSILTLITFLLMIGVVVLFSFQPARDITHRITSEGIQVGQAFYPHRAIKRFWLNYQPPVEKTLNFETSTYLNNRIRVQLGNQDPIIIKLVLSEYLLEDLEHEDTLRETLAKRLKI
jgi:hypothetical protein